MGLNFRKSLSLGKLFRINFSKGGISVSAGVKGARVSVGKNGVRETVSLPGTGLSWSERQSFKKRKGVAGDSSGIDGIAPSKANKKADGKRKWKSLIWVALVAGGFLLYRSGVLDSAIATVKQAMTGDGTVVSAKAENVPTPVVDITPGSGIQPESGNASGNSADTKDSLQSEEITEATASPSEAPSVSLTADPVSGSTSAYKVVLKDGEVVLAKGTLFVASKSGEKFHKPDCRILGSIVKKNLVEYDSREDAAKEKDPCSICNP